MTQRQLLITNGDSAGNTLRETGIAAQVLPWRDILHDGPVPGGLDLAALAPVRAGFLAQPPIASYDEILQSFRERDRTLAAYRDYDSVSLWLEHDLYDQLQLLQVLDWFADADIEQPPLYLLCIDRFPGVDPFYGLGQLDVRQMASLQGSETLVTPEQLELGREGWQAFTADTPLPLLNFLQRDMSALPFLGAALKRHLEEYPDSRTGLSRHERQILDMVDAGIQRPGRLFAEHQRLEAAPYLGDWGFWSLLQRLTNSPQGLLMTDQGRHFVRPPDVPGDDAFRLQTFSLSPELRAVLSGDADWVTLNPPDFWKGGVHLHPDKGIWRWSAEQKTIVGPEG